MAVNPVYPAHSPANTPPVLHPVPELVRFGPFTLTTSAMERLVYRARALQIVVRDAHAPGKPTTYSTSVGFGGASIPIDVETWKCGCWLGSRGLPCVHAAAVLYSLSGQKQLRQCGVCGRWEYRGHGEYRHVGGQPDRWECTHCLGGAA